MDRLIESKEQPMSRSIIQTNAAPQAIGPYSQAVQAGQFLFVSGQIALDPVSGELLAGTAAAQTTRVLHNLQAILEAAGSSLEHIVKTTVFLASMDDFAAMNEVYATFFENEPPARTTIQVAALPKQAQVEIEAIALLP
jgi:2-iminobutanoate/2-iminopropanoate deaminase